MKDVIVRRILENMRFISTEIFQCFFNKEYTTRLAFGTRTKMKRFIQNSHTKYK